MPSAGQQTAKVGFGGAAQISGGLGSSRVTCAHVDGHRVGGLAQSLAFLKERVLE